MNIDIFAKNIELDNPLRTFVNEKIGALERLIGNKGAIGVQVEIGKPSHHHHKGPFFYAEINMRIGGQLLRAEEKHEDLRTAIDLARDEIKIQIKKLKDRSKDLSRQSRR